MTNFSPSKKPKYKARYASHTFSDSRQWPLDRRRRGRSDSRHRHCRAAPSSLTGEFRRSRGALNIARHMGGQAQKQNTSRTIMTTLEIKGDWNITESKLK